MTEEIINKGIKLRNRIKEIDILSSKINLLKNPIVL